MNFKVVGYHKLERTVIRKHPEQETIEADGIIEEGDSKEKNDKYFMKVRATYKDGEQKTSSKYN